MKPSERIFLFLALVLSYQLYQLKTELRVTQSRMIFDIDKTRKSFYEEMSYMYSVGCRIGIDYPEEYRRPVTEFNEHSPVNYCNDHKDRLNQYMDIRIKELGK